MSSCTMQSYGLGNDHFLSGVQSVFRVYLSTRSRASWGAGNFSKGKCLQVKGKKSPIGCAQADHCHHCLVAADRRPVCAIASVFEQRFSARLSSVPMSDHSRPLRCSSFFLDHTNSSVHSSTLAHTHTHRGYIGKPNTSNTCTLSTRNKGLKNLLILYLYTRHIFHEMPFTAETALNSFYPRSPVHPEQKPFTPETFYTKQLFHQKGLHPQL